MDINIFVPFMCGLFSLGAGFFVLIKTGKSYLSRPYFIASLAVSGYFFMALCLNRLVGTQLWLLRTYIISSLFTVPALLNIFSSMYQRRKWLLNAFLFFSSVLSFCSLYFFSRGWFFPIRMFSWGASVSADSLFYFIFFLNAVVFLPVSCVVAWINKDQSDFSQLAKQQMAFIVISILFIAIAMILNLLPAFDLEFYPAGMPLMTIAFVAMAYAITQYRLLQLDIIAGKALMIFLLVVPLIMLHAFISVFFLKRLGFLFATTFSLLVVIYIGLFTPYKKLLEKRVGRAVYGGKYDYQKVILELSQSLSAIVDSDQLLDSVMHILAQTIEAEKIAVFIEEEDSRDFVLKTAYGLALSEGSQILNSKTPAVVRLKKEGRILVKGELRQFEKSGKVEKLFEPLSAVSAELIVPLFYKDRLMGIVTLSSKKSGDIYNQMDIDVLNVFAGEASKAIEHVRLYNDAITDTATLVFNQNYFLTRLREEIARSKRYGRPISLLLIEVSNAAEFDSAYGHATGDLLLKSIGLLLKTKLRTIDVLARYSGNRFSIILPETTADKGNGDADVLIKHKNDTMIVARRLTKAVNEFKSSGNGKPMDINVNIGVAYFDGADKRFGEEKFISRAEQALLKSKSASKNHIYCFEGGHE